MSKVGSITRKKKAEVSNLNFNGIENIDSPQNLVIAESAISVNRGLKRKSIYSDFLCIDCQDKNITDYCKDCKPSYSNAKRRKSRKYGNKTIVDGVYLHDMPHSYNLNEENMTDLANSTDLNESISSPQSENLMNTLKKKPKGNWSSKTFRNAKWQLNKFVTKRITKSPSKKKKLYAAMQNQNTNEIIASDLENQLAAKLAGEMIRNMKIAFGEKSELVYSAISFHSHYFKDKTITSIQKYLGLNFENAKKVKNGIPLGKKVYNKTVDSGAVEKIVKYFLDDRVSKASPGLRGITKRDGVCRFMYTTVKIAYINFTNEHPDCKVGYSTFHKLKPKNVKTRAKTPFVSSLCPYCHNISLKCSKIGSSNVKNEYDLFDYLTCKPADGQLTNAACFKRKCEKCCNWEDKLDALLSTVPRKDTDVFIWYSWEIKHYERPNGKKGTCRELVYHEKTFKVFRDEFLRDITKPLLRCTFPEHFFAKKYQKEMFHQSKLSLKIGQCIMVQDFAKNRDIVFQDEIKSNYWVKKQVTLHPSVLFYKLTDEQEEPNKLVITHLSDIKNHDAHMVHFITKECISILQDKHPEINWDKFIVWSDGCASQYKGKNAFYYLDKYSINLERNYFASEHGKGPADAETGQLSMQLLSAIKSKEVHIDSAVSMQDFFVKKYAEDEKRLFKLVKVDDMELIMKNFRGITVDTLEGQCTRTLHQIKQSSRSNFLLQRPFSCFCQFCENDESGKCVYKDYTGGNFKSCKLPSSDKCKPIEEEKDDEDSYDGDLSVERTILEEENEIQITIEKDDLSFENLNVGDWVVVLLEKKSRKKKKMFDDWVFRISEIDEEEEEYLGHFYAPQFDTESFYITNEPVCRVGLDEVVMVLPEPIESRGRYIFHGHLNLRKDLDIEI